MKIGIITFHRAINYGSILQAYALSRFLRDEVGENNVEVIDYQNCAQKKIYKLFEFPKNIKSALRDIQTFANICALRRKYKKFEEFAICKLGLTAKKYGESDIVALSNDSKKYTHLISGSDQIWNVKCADFDENYFLTFNENAKKIAYAPSLGRLDFANAEKEFIRCNVKSYDALSSREKISAGYLRKLCGREVECVLDPVFLLPASRWNKIAAKPADSEKYILCYFIGNVPGMRRFAKGLSRKTGLKAISIIKNLRDIFSGFETRLDADPQDFLGLISNAEYVVTDSFHAVSFSLIYHRNFWAFSPSESAGERGSWTRIPNLLNIAGLENRILNADNCDSVNIYESIDFKKVDSNLVPQIEKSKLFLRKSLGVIK